MFTGVIGFIFHVTKCKTKFKVICVYTSPEWSWVAAVGNVPVN